MWVSCESTLPSSSRAILYQGICDSASRPNLDSAKFSTEFAGRHHTYHHLTGTQCHRHLHLDPIGRQNATSHVIDVVKQRPDVRLLWDLSASNASAVDSTAASLVLALALARQDPSLMQLCSNRMAIELQRQLLSMVKGLLRARHGRKAPWCLGWQVVHRNFHKSTYLPWPFIMTHLHYRRRLIYSSAHSLPRAWKGCKGSARSYSGLLPSLILGF